MPTDFSAKMQVKTIRPLRVGLFGIGLDAYWPQFKGLKTRLEDYVRFVRGRLERPGVDVVNLGLIDSPPKALDAGHCFRQEDVDLIFPHLITFALSAKVRALQAYHGRVGRDFQWKCRLTSGLSRCCQCC